MTHKLFELNAMNREQLETIAEELNIKGIKKLDDENLAYKILDAQADAESVKVKDAPEKPKTRRGRPPKEKAAEKPAEKAAKPAEAAPAAAAMTSRYLSYRRPCTARRTRRCTRPCRRRCTRRKSS